MRESELKALFINFEEESAKHLKIFLNVTRCFRGDERVLQPFLKSQKDLIEQLSATLADEAEKREDIDLLKQTGRNSPQQRGLVMASMYAHPTAQYIESQILRPLQDITSERLSGDVEKLRTAIQKAEELTDRVASMVKAKAVEDGMAVPDALTLAKAVEKEYRAGLYIATSPKVKTRDQAIKALGLGR